ncbi:MAG: hypothetical protein K2J39_00185 [Ruminococcus sp.]|nr:hypothetical protein [Ruminococcus sp.]
MKVFLFAHSGGNVWTYSRLFSSVEGHEFIPVELPGNVSRFRDKLPNNFEGYLETAYQIIMQKVDYDEEIALFGHSFGGYLLYDLSLMLVPRVKRVIISCSTPFHRYTLPPESIDYSSLYNFPVKPDKKIVEVFNPIIRHKIELIDAYKERFSCNSDIKLSDTKATLIYASDDIMTGYIYEWSKYFGEGNCEIIKFDGGHFYWMETEENKKKLCRLIAERLKN